MLHDSCSLYETGLQNSKYRNFRPYKETNKGTNKHTETVADLNLSLSIMPLGDEFGSLLSHSLNAPRIRRKLRLECRVLLDFALKVRRVGVAHVRRDVELLVQPRRHLVRVSVESLQPPAHIAFCQTTKTEHQINFIDTVYYLLLAAFGLSFPGNIF